MSALLLCTALAVLGGGQQAWSQSPDPFWVDVDVHDDRTILIFGNVGTPRHDMPSVSFLIEGVTVHHPDRAQTTIDSSGNFEVEERVPYDGTYRVEARYAGDAAEKAFRVGPPEPPPVVDAPATEPEPASEPEQATEPDPVAEEPASPQYGGREAVLAASAYMQSCLNDPLFCLDDTIFLLPNYVWIVIIVGFAGLLWYYMDQRKQMGKQSSHTGQKGQAADASKAAETSKAAVTPGRGHLPAASKAAVTPGRGQFPAASKATEAPWSKQAPDKPKDETIFRKTGEFQAVYRPTPDSRKGKKTTVQADGLEMERNKIRKLLGSGIIIPDTNICLDHLYYWAERKSIERMWQLRIEKRRTNMADDVVHECLDIAIDQERVWFPHVISKNELVGQLNKMQREEQGGSHTIQPKDQKFTNMITDNSKLLGYSEAGEHTRRKCSDGKAEEVSNMYEGFKSREDARKGINSIRARTKPYPPQGGDIFILGTAAEIASSGEDVRLLTLDSDFTEFIDQIKDILHVSIIDGNPYVRIGRALYGSKDYEQAAQYLREGVRLNRESNYGLYYCAKALFAQKQSKEARAEAMHILAIFEVDEEDSSSVFKKADLHFEANEYHKADSSFTAAIRLGRGLHDALKGNAQKADERKRQEINMAHMLTRKGHALMERGMAQKSDRRPLFQEARDCFRQALDLRPGYDYAEKKLRKVSRWLEKMDAGR